MEVSTDNGNTWTINFKKQGKRVASCLGRVAQALRV
jgi:hypothetical protein